MNIDFALKVITVSASGALAPGPLTAATAALGAKGGWRAGVGVAVGHTIVELPLVLLIAYGLGELLANPAAKLALGLAGGTFMLLFGYLTLKSALKTELKLGNDGPSKGPVATGLALSLFNPLFIMWWLGVGSPLIVEALAYGVVGLLAFYIVHVWLDYAWLTVVSSAGSLTKFNAKAYRLVLASLAILVIYYGATTVFATLYSVLAPTPG